MYLFRELETIDGFTLWVHKNKVEAVEPVANTENSVVRMDSGKEYTVKGCNEKIRAFLETSTQEYNEFYGEVFKEAAELLAEELKGHTI